jgi:phosphatidylinositol alpha-1,6-mannosyltransferase
LRILAISTDYPPQHGGIATLSHATVTQFHELGHDVHVIATTDSPEKAAEFDRVQPFPTIRTPDRLVFRELALLWSIRRELAEFKPDVVWSAVWFPAAVLVSYLARPGRPKQTVSAYGAEILPYQDGWRQKLKARLGFLRTRVFRRADVIFALSRYTREQLLALGAPESKVVISPGGVGDEWFTITRSPSADSFPILLTVARLDENKGHDMVIRALPAVLKQYPTLVYRIIGPGAENWPHLAELARSCGVENSVIYSGLVSKEELRKAYSEATIFVLASREISGQLVEGFGLTLLEAAAASIPTIAGNSGGVPDAIEDQRTGFLVDPNRPDEIGAYVLKLLNEHELARNMGAYGCRRAKQDFTWNAVVSKMLVVME